MKLELPIKANYSKEIYNFARAKSMTRLLWPKDPLLFRGNAEHTLNKCWNFLVSFFLHPTGYGSGEMQPKRACASESGPNLRYELPSNLRPYKIPFSYLLSSLLTIPSWLMCALSLQRAVLLPKWFLLGFLLTFINYLNFLSLKERKRGFDCRKPIVYCQSKV